MLMLFEYDPAKSTTNKAKHGIDFDEAQVLWKMIGCWKLRQKPMTSRASW